MYNNVHTSCHLSDDRPGSVPALELISRAASSVGVMYGSTVPTQGVIPEEGGYKKTLSHPVVVLGKYLTQDVF